MIKLRTYNLHIFEKEIKKCWRRIILTSILIIFGYIIGLLLILWAKSGVPPKYVDIYKPMFASSKFWVQELPITIKLKAALSQKIFLIYGEGEALGVGVIPWTFGLSIEGIITLLVLSILYSIVLNMIIIYRGKIRELGSWHVNRSAKAAVVLSSIFFMAGIVSERGAALGACCSVDPRGVSFLVLFDISYSTAFLLSEYFTLIFIFGAMGMLISIFYIGRAIGEVNMVEKR